MANRPIGFSPNALPTVVSATVKEPASGWGGTIGVTWSSSRTGVTTMSPEFPGTVLLPKLIDGSRKWLLPAPIFTTWVASGSLALPLGVGGVESSAIEYTATSTVTETLAGFVTPM